MDEPPVVAEVQAVVTTSPAKALDAIESLIAAYTWI